MAYHPRGRLDLRHQAVFARRESGSPEPLPTAPFSSTLTDDGQGELVVAPTYGC